MADFTENYNLKKPADTDFYNVQDFNNNADIIDSALAGKLDVDSTDNLAKETSVQEVITKVNTNAKETSLQNLSNKIGNYSDEGTSSVFAKINSIDTNVDKILNSNSQDYKQVMLQKTSFYIKTSVTNCLEINGAGKLIGIMYSLGAFVGSGRQVYARILIDNKTILYVNHSGGASNSRGNMCIATSEYAPHQSTYENNYCITPGSNCSAKTFGLNITLSETLQFGGNSTSETDSYTCIVIDKPIQFNGNLTIQCHNNASNEASNLSYLTVWYTLN